MNIERIHNYLSSNQPTKKKDSPRNAKPSAVNKGDKLEISNEAKQLSGGKSIVEVAQNQLSQIPDIRQAKIDEVKGKIAKDFYNNDQVITELADHLAYSPELITAMANQNREANADISPQQLNKLSVVANRMDRDFYDSIEVLDKVAGNILDKLRGQS